jgi:hypothetical protein
MAEDLGGGGYCEHSNEIPSSYIAGCFLTIRVTILASPEDSALSSLFQFGVVR